MKLTEPCPALFLNVMMAAVAHVNLSLMVDRFTLFQHWGTKKIPQNLYCSSDNFLYLINCKRFIKHVNTLAKRVDFWEQRRGIKNKTNESVRIHFNQPKHTLNDIQLIPVLHINNNRDSIRRSMEQHLIERAGTLQNST